MMGTLVAYWSITEFGFVTYPALQRRFTNPQKAAQSADRSRREKEKSPTWIAHKIRRVAACVRNNSVTQDPALTVPLKAILPIYIVGVFYCHARAYIFIGDMIQLRSLPDSAFQTVDWIQLIPHF
jgi:hypothetical protein